MKIVRMGRTEAGLLFLDYVLKYHKSALSDVMLKAITNGILYCCNWLYTTSGYYDKSVKGSYFDFDKSCLNENYNYLLECFRCACQGCDEAQIYLHDGFVMHLYSLFGEKFKLDYNISNFVLYNTKKFLPRLPKIFECIKDKKVLIISSFSELISKQYVTGNIYKLGNNSNFPNIKSLSTIQTPYCFFNNGPHNNYFETLQSIFEQVEENNFDIALIGFGSYGHILTDRIHNELKKDAISLGGYITLLFGILSSRELITEDAKPNEYWITNIPDKYKPKDYKKIENGCYW